MPESNQASFARKFRPYLVLIVVSVLVIWKFGGRFKEAYFPVADTTPSTTSKIRHINNFEVLDGCQLVDDKDNDGDSFRIKHGNSEYTLRLYFVETPVINRNNNQQTKLEEQG